MEAGRDDGYSKRWSVLSLSTRTSYGNELEHENIIGAWASVGKSGSLSGGLEYIQVWRVKTLDQS